MLQEDDCLGVVDLAGTDLGECTRQRKFEHLDVFALVEKAAASLLAVGGAIDRAEEEQALGEDAGTHEEGEEQLWLMKFDACLFARLATDSVDRFATVEKAGDGFDQMTIMVGAGGGEAELTHKEDGAAIGIKGKNGGCVATLVGFARQGLPGPVMPMIVEGRLLQHAVALGQNFDFADTNTIVHGTSLAGASPVELYRGRHELHRNTMRALFASMILLLPAWGVFGAVPGDEPPGFLTDVQGKQALEWVRSENKRSLAVLQGDPHYAGFRQKALALGQAKDRIPAPEFIGQDIYNFWQDPSHVHGVWRRTSLASYRTANPAWTTVLDLDALSAKDHAGWVWKGADCEAPAYRRCLISLSNGGEDAKTIREFDLITRSFVPGGFSLPRSKQDVDWAGDNAVLVARDWGPGTMSTSGYPFVLKMVKRGDALTSGTPFFRGKVSDVGVSGGLAVDGDGHRVTVVVEQLDAFDSKYYLASGTSLTPLGVPARSEMQGFVKNRLIFEIDSNWHPSNGPLVKAGSLVSVDLGRAGNPVETIFVPGPRQSLLNAATTRETVVAAIDDNVRGQGWIYSASGNGWTGRRLALPDNASIDVVTASDKRDQAFLSVTGFLSPTQVWLMDADAVLMLKALPAKFDASGMVVEQDEALSKDGTKIPYFLVHARGMVLDGKNPTQLYAYGGFQVSMTPIYDPNLGALWLSHGGVYALANIRGGGEFGPAWHDVATKTHRQIAWDDFAAVGEDLIARKVTDTRHLGIRGGSNGGLLMGAEFTQHPELWHAVVIEVPLLDMENYETMSAGASWVGEYGSMSNPDERKFLQSTSPLQNLRTGIAYPEPFIFTTTKDDRVGPVHARRFAWRLGELHVPFLYYEEMEGGHAAGANLREVATERALEYTYLTMKLME